ncbi:hypothetical protein RESH_03070 [Rhodopirellula europaea SH398]|uniref:Uncharacterized protein n=1 Tax=Rhodopirellula europaea SH398 TaxID=1263868 RepID=M5SJ85_9BACT|nr:hypothetical protein RESH_03070 [Rhodopirellula europaea SH398]
MVLQSISAAVPVRSQRNERNRTTQVGSIGEDVATTAFWIQLVERFELAAE